MIQTLNEGVSSNISESCVYNTGLYVPHATMDICAKYCFTHPTLSTVTFPTVSKQMGSCHKR